MRFFKRFKRGQHGFTLVELMVVMAIIAVMAAIVIPPVTGTKQVSSDSQVKQDASAVSTAVSKFNADQNLAENLATDNRTTVLAESLTSPNVEITSNKWPEQSVTAAYGEEFPASNSVVTSVTIQKLNQANTVEVLYSTSNAVATKTLDDFVTIYNAVNFTTLKSLGYIQQKPNGVDATMTVGTTTRTYHNYLWLVKKVKVDTDDTAGRVVEVYSLITVTSSAAGVDALIYQRVY